MEHNLNRSRGVEPVGPCTISTQQQFREQHVVTHVTQQDDGGSVVRLQANMDPKQLGSYRLAADRGLHIFEGRIELELKDQYHYLMRKSKGIEHRNAVNSQEGTKQIIVHQSSSLQGTKFHDNAQIIMGTNN